MSTPDSGRRPAVPSMPRPARRAPVYGKRAIVERLLRAWEARPEMRLGELVQNAMYARTADGLTDGATLYFTDDETLATVVELFASARGASTHGKGAL